MRKHGLAALFLAVLGSLVALVPGAPGGDEPARFHRDNFSGRNVGFIQADASVRFEEKDHKLSDEHCKSARTSEYIKLEVPGTGSDDDGYIHYSYAVPPAAVDERLVAGVWVKAYKAGVRLKARVVLPKERDPRNPDAPLTTTIVGDRYEKTRQWQPLRFGDGAVDTLKKHLPILHARLGHAVDASGAYVDRIIVDCYTGAGVTEVWIDDLEVGPTLPGAELPRDRRPAGKEVGRPKSKPRAVEFSDGQILVEHDDGEMRPFFMLAIRHTDTPLHVLRDAQFNTVWFPDDAAPETIEEAIRHGFWIVPTLPLPAGEWDGRKPKRPDAKTLERDADSVAKYLQKFLSGDAVLMWDFGSGRVAEDISRVARVSDLVRTHDPKRPRAADLWDGYEAYSNYVNAIGTHRWPLFTSLELTDYRDWLLQRRALTGAGKMMWTWVQTHLPEWYVQSLTGKPECFSYDDPIGPHPEQIRTLAYLSLASGCRGLGFWSDKYLTNACHGRDRLLELALLNAEIEMVKPVLFAAQDPAKWIGTSDGNVKAAVIRGPKELLVLPVWLGSGSQYVPAQASLAKLTLTVPMVPDGATPWLVSPSGVTELKEVKRVAGGTEINIPEFDTSAMVVFTADHGGTGKVVRWQDETRFKLGHKVAEWTILQAVEQYNKAHTVHCKIIQAGGPEIPEAGDLFARGKAAIDRAKEYASNKQWEQATREAKRAMRPLRAIMRQDWENAVKPLDTPTASPFAVSFFSLPRHWEFASAIAASKLGANVFEHGGFELSRPAPPEGAAISSLPGWEVRKMILNNAEGTASIINSEGLVDPKPEPAPLPRDRYSPLRSPQYMPDYRQPEAGKQCLRLVIKPKNFAKPGEKVGPPQALERAVLAVDSPTMSLAPGSIVRISFWAKIVEHVTASADGLVVFDSSGGEPLGARFHHTANKWKQVHLYRRVPSDGKISMTFALTGFGTAYIDDVRMEPLSGGESAQKRSSSDIRAVEFRQEPTRK